MSTEHLSHAPQNGQPVHPDVAFEKTDVRTSAIIKFLVYLGIGVVLSYLLTFAIYKALKSYWADSYKQPLPTRMEAGPTLPPEPRLQGMPGHLIDPQQDMRNKILADMEANDKLGWIDQKAGIAQIPVKDAMQLIVEKGLPAVTPQPAEKK
jgi:hypothetical protein